MFHGYEIRYETWETFKESRVIIFCKTPALRGMVLAEVWDYGARVYRAHIHSETYVPEYILDAGYLYMNSEYKNTMPLLDFITNMFPDIDLLQYDHQAAKKI